MWVLNCVDFAGCGFNFIARNLSIQHAKSSILAYPAQFALPKRGTTPLGGEFRLGAISIDGHVCGLDQNVRRTEPGGKPGSPPSSSSQK